MCTAAWAADSLDQLAQDVTDVYFTRLVDLATVSGMYNNLVAFNDQLDTQKNGYFCHLR